MADVSDASSEMDEEVLLLILLLRRRRRRLRAPNRKTWAREWILRRDVQGAASNLIRELDGEDPKAFREYHRMDRESFEDILTLIDPLIARQDTHMRDAITPRARLSVTLRFLATGIGLDHCNIF